MQTIYELVTVIRDLINHPRKQAELFKNPKTWGMLCSSLDAIQDTECALLAYLAGSDSQGGEPEIDQGNLYLLLYGVLQVLYVQQDALKHLHQSLGFTHSRTPRVTEIREARNDAIGHPTSRWGKAFSFVTSTSLSYRGCQLLTFRDDWSSEFTQLDLKQMVDDQRDTMKTSLTELIAQLKAQEMAHREQFKGKKLAGAFPQTLNYFHEKIAESIPGTGNYPRSFGAGLLEDIQKSIDTFKAELAARGAADAYDSINYAIEELDYPIAQLLKFLQDSPESKLNEKDASIVHFFILEKLRGLIEIARNLDAEYEETL